MQYFQKGFRKIIYLYSRSFCAGYNSVAVFDQGVYDTRRLKRAQKAFRNELKQVYCSSYCAFILYLGSLTGVSFK